MQAVINLLFFFFLLSLKPTAHSQCAPLPNAYAHNDYWHERPLHDALENGFTYIEADIFLINNNFIVAHIFPFFKDERTLENLYLRPLYERIKHGNGKVYQNYSSSITLMIDIKSNGEKTYAALKHLLTQYSSILTSYENGKIIERQITIVLSGNKPYKMLKSENYRLAFIDEDLTKIKHDAYKNTLCPIASCKFSDLINWDGNKPLDKAQKEKLYSYVKTAHKQGKKVRLWASPEKESVWAELLECEVDLINTDKLRALNNFLTLRNTKYLAADK